MTHLSLGSSCIFSPLLGGEFLETWGCLRCLSRESQPSCLGKSSTCLGRTNIRCLGRSAACLALSACTACSSPWQETSAACLGKVIPNCLGRNVNSLGRTNTSCLGGGAACLELSAHTACGLPWLGTRIASLGKVGPNYMGRGATCLGRTDISCLERSITCLLGRQLVFLPRQLVSSRQ